jgi:hypothetical protein
MQNHGKTHDLLLFPTRLLLDAVQRTGGNVAVRVLDRHQARLGRMLELVMRAFDPRQKPAIGFELLDYLFAVHGGYYNHLTNKSNTITSLIQSGETLRFEGDVGDLLSLNAETDRRGRSKLNFSIV